MQVSSYIFQSPYSQPLQVGHPAPEMVQDQQEKTQEQLNKSRENTTALIGAQSKQYQGDISIKSSTMYQNNPNNSDSASAVKAYASSSQEAMRSQNISTYAVNGNDLSALTTVQ